MSTNIYHCRSYGETSDCFGITIFRYFTKYRLTVTKLRRIVGMADHRDSQPLFDDPKRLLLDMAQEQSLPELLHLIASRLGDSPRIALVRIWLAQPTADCTDCPTLEQCRGQARCLYLVASGGRSAATPSAVWTRLDGAFQRFPFGARKVGQIA